MAKIETLSEALNRVATLPLAFHSEEWAKSAAARWNDEPWYLIDELEEDILCHEHAGNFIKADCIKEVTSVLRQYAD